MVDSLVSLMRYLKYYNIDLFDEQYREINYYINNNLRGGGDDENYKYTRIEKFLGNNRDEILRRLKNIL